ncbi:PcfJ domain-containing protein [Enterococcus alishanensis]
MKINLGQAPLKAPQRFHDWCLNQIPIYQWQNKEKTILSSNREHGWLIKKRLTKSSQLNKPFKFYSFAIVLVSKTRIEIQSHCYYQVVKDGKEQLDYEMGNLERFAKDHHLKAHEMKDCWYEGLLNNYGYMSSAYTNTTFYENDWQRKLKDNQGMKYLDLGRIDIYQLRQSFKYRSKIEYLQKVGATNIASDLINESITIDNRIMTDKWLKKNKVKLKKNPSCFGEIIMGNYFEERKSRLVKGFERLIDYRELAKIPKELKLIRFQNWLIKQQKSFKYYLDYLSLVDDLEIPKDSELVLMPRNLQKKHDECVDTLNYLKEQKRLEELKEEQKALEKRLKATKRYELTLDDYSFIVPHSLKEIMNEGKSLGHCVGSSTYLKAHSKGKSTIIFIRRADKPEEPYFTMEYSNKQIKQIQGKRNREEIPKEVRRTANKWLEKVNKI